MVTTWPMQKLPDPDGLVESLHWKRRYRSDVGVGAQQGGRPFTQEDLARRRTLLEPCREVHGLPGHQELSPLQPLRVGDHFAGIQPHPKLGQLPGLDLGSDTLADGERGARRAFRIILMHIREPEHGDDGIADELLDRAAVTLEDGAGGAVVAA